MKKYIFSVAIISTLILGACSSDEKTSEETPKTNTETVAAEESTTEPNTPETTEVAEESESGKEIKDGVLLNAGDWTMSGLDKVTLVKIKEVNETFTMGPINLTIDSIKLLHHSKVDEAMKSYINSVHGKDVEELNTIQIIYNVENTSDANVMFRTVDTVTTDTKAQISGMHDMATSNDYGTYMGQVIVDGLKIFPYFNGSLEDINSINIITSDVYDNDSITKLGDGQKIEIKF